MWPLRWSHRDCLRLVDDGSDQAPPRWSGRRSKEQVLRDVENMIPNTLTPGQVLVKVKPSTISTAQLHPSPDFHMPPIKQVVFLRSYPVNPVGNLILRRASHLDAFSAYPNRT